MSETIKQPKLKPLSDYSDKRNHLNVVDNISIIIFYYIFLFFLFEFDFNAVKYTQRLATEYPPELRLVPELRWVPELRRVPGLIESTANPFSSHQVCFGWTSIVLSVYNVQQMQAKSP